MELERGCERLLGQAGRGTYEHRLFLAGILTGLSIMATSMVVAVERTYRRMSFSSSFQLTGLGTHVVPS